MDVKKYNTIIYTINSIDEFNTYVKDFIYKNSFKETPSFLIDSVLNLLNKTEMYKTEFDKNIKKIFSDNGRILSKAQNDFWLYKGYSYDDSKNLVTNNQKKCSKRSIEYWLNKGYSIEDSNNKVSNHQKEIGKFNSKLSKSVLRRRSIRCKEYWINMGYDEPIAISKVSTIQKKYAKNYWETATDIQKERSRLVGDRNGMYGKPPPIGSGNGWSGWFDGFYFRSLHELNYLVNVISRFNLKFKTAETLKYRIPYIDSDGKSRTYSGDYIINDKYYVEIKPKKLQSTTINKIKKEYAIKFCENLNLKYKVVDCGIISFTDLIKLVENNRVIFTKKYQNKFKQYLFKITENVK